MSSSRLLNVPSIEEILFFTEPVILHSTVRAVVSSGTTIGYTELKQIAIEPGDVLRVCSIGSNKYRNVITLELILSKNKRLSNTIRDEAKIWFISIHPEMTNIKVAIRTRNIRTGCATINRKARIFPSLNALDLERGSQIEEKEQTRWDKIIQ
jgi:hypothetical protein